MWLGALVAIATMGAFSDSASIPLRHGAVPEQQGSRRQAHERGSVRLPRQAKAVGTSHRHPVSGPRDCRALPPHFPRCSLGFLTRSELGIASKLFFDLLDKDTASCLARNTKRALH